ncbi:MAG: hypothetical protein ABEJ40_04530 [Haloarculaceae archaeon]
MTLDRRPPRSAVALAALPGGFAVVALAVVPAAFVLGLVGLVLIAAGTATGRRHGATLGTLSLFAGAGPGLLLLSTAGAVTGGTTAHHVVGLGRQLGRGAPVRRSVLAHLAGATVATLTVGGLALASFRVAEGAVPAAGVGFSLVGAAALLAALRA